MNAVNLPLALLTIILRRFIDKFRAAQGTVILKSSAHWFIDMPLVKSCMYAYMFFAGIYYTMKHMRRGTIVSLAKKCSGSAVTSKNRKRAYSNKDRSSLVKNLIRGRDGQQKALKYIASMIPQESINISAPNILTYNNDEKMDRSSQSFQQELSNYTANPYFEPSSIHRGHTLSLTRHRPRYSIPPSPMLDTLPDPTLSSNEDVVKIDLTESKETTPVGLGTITIPDEIQPDRMEEEGKPRRKRRSRNCLTLRGRKILKNDLPFCGDNIVRKTRSGKVYGFHSMGMRGARKLL